MLFKTQDNKPSIATVVPVETIVPISDSQKILPPKEQVAFSFTYPPSLPDSLPTYSVSYPNSILTSVSTIATQWRFTTPFKNPVSYVYDWVEKDKLLTYNSKSKGLSFSFFNQSTTTNALFLTKDSVFDTLSSASFFSNDFAFVESDRSKGEGAEGQSDQNSQITILTYQAKSKTVPYPFFFTGITPASGEIRIAESGNVISFAFYATPTIEQNDTRQTLKSEEILTHLTENKGYIAGISGAVSGYPFDETANYDRVEIQSVSVSYLLIPEESLFVPIYVISGVGVGKGTTQSVKIYLRATS